MQMYRNSAVPSPQPQTWVKLTCQRILLQFWLLLYSRFLSHQFLSNQLGKQQLYIFIVLLFVKFLDWMWKICQLFRFKRLFHHQFNVQQLWKTFKLLCHQFHHFRYNDKQLKRTCNIRLCNNEQWVLHNQRIFNDRQLCFRTMSSSRASTRQVNSSIYYLRYV